MRPRPAPEPAAACARAARALLAAWAKLTPEELARCSPAERRFIEGALTGESIETLREMATWDEDGDGAL